MGATCSGGHASLAPCLEDLRNDCYESDELWQQEVQDSEPKRAAMGVAAFASTPSSVSDRVSQQCEELEDTTAWEDPPDVGQPGAVDGTDTLVRKSQDDPGRTLLPTREPGLDHQKPTEAHKSSVVEKPAEPSAPAKEQNFFDCAETPVEISGSDKPAEAPAIEVEVGEVGHVDAAEKSAGQQIKQILAGRAFRAAEPRQPCRRRSESTPASVRPRRAAALSGSDQPSDQRVMRRATFHLTGTEQPPGGPVEQPEAMVEVQSEGSDLGDFAGDKESREGGVGGELWADFVQRAQSRVEAAEVKDNVQALFEAFRTAEDVEVIYSTFACLFQKATSRSEAPWSNFEQEKEVTGRPHSWTFPYEPIRVICGGNWKAKKLWKLLDDRCAKAEYEEAPCSQGHLAGRCMVVVGAGPCGLRAAIELRLLGARVTVVDRRTKFSRINQLHLWEWCGEELKALGARVLEPPAMDFGSNPDLLHVGISDLQKLLLKVSLLLGVEVLLGTDYAGAQWDASSSSWSVSLRAAAGASSVEGRAGETLAKGSRNGEGESASPSPAPPGRVTDVAGLVVANGFGSTIGQDHGLRVAETESLRRESAVGLICNFQRSNGNEERKLRSYSMAKQFYLPFFRKVAETTGADLENIVYTKGHESHYMVMTPTHKSLVESGVIIDKSRSPMLTPENVDQEKLHTYVRKVASFQFKANEPAVLAAAAADLGAKTTVVPFADAGPRLFDFSKMRRHVDGLTFMQPPGREEEACPTESLVVVVVGDALIEPFWPEGLGIVRGFFSVLDGCSAVAEWARGVEKARVQLHFDAAFKQLKTLGAATRSRVLKDDLRAYGLAPSTRYRQFKS